MIFRGVDFDKSEPLNPGGSGRQYSRLSSSSCPDVSPVILCEGISSQENHTFLELSRTFANTRGGGLNVPRVLYVWDDGMKYLLEDCGKESLYDLIIRCRTAGGNVVELCKPAMQLLARFQVLADEVVDYGVCYPVPQFDRTSIMWDLNYFKYCFIKPRFENLDELALEEDFKRLADDLLAAPCDVFMFRDFQSRNILVDGTKMTFIDYQGGRRGPMHYDVASFLWQARADFKDEERDKLVDAYLDSMEQYRKVDKKEFKERLPIFVFFRILQTLGAYGFRGEVQHKRAFLSQVPNAIENVRRLAANSDFTKYPYLLSLLLSSPQSKPLTVTVTSFSYKKGYPEDPTGNGGGFVIDCRAPNNPGRYEKYKTMTGRDAEVKEFIEKDGELPQLLAYVFPMVDASVRRYLERGFTSLSVAFGCTGGQHRSVYAAEKMAQHLRILFPTVNVNLIHREQPMN